MKLSHRKRAVSRPPELTMTSLIDVVFLLLIFFLATTTFVRTEKQLSSSIDYQDAESTENASFLEPAVIRIRGAQGSVVFRYGAVVTSDLVELKRWLKQFTGKSEGAFLVVGKGVEFDLTAQLISYCRQVGFSEVTYVPDPG